MNLTEIITRDLTQAMKSGDKIRIETLRSVRAAILEFQKRKAGAVLTESDEIELLAHAAKRRKESIEQYEGAGREDLAGQERRELEILSAYLPAQADDDEIVAVITRLMSENSVTDMKGMGKVMGPAMKELKGRADGAHVQEMVRKILGGA